MKLYRCTETGEIITKSQLKAEFEVLQAEQPQEYNYTFKQYILNCTNKNGFLKEVKIND